MFYGFTSKNRRLSNIIMNRRFRFSLGLDDVRLRSETEGVNASDA